MRRGTERMRGWKIRCGVVAVLLGGTAAVWAIGGEARSREDLTIGGGQWVSPLPLRVEIPVRATAALLMEASTGEVLYERRSSDLHPPASLTKIMTAILILERGSLDEVVMVSAHAAAAPGYRLGLRPGHQITLGDLVRALLIRSANDAAVAAAEHMGETEREFVALMNAKAAALGMRNTHFANPHGLDDLEHYSTAYDLALLTRYAMANEMFSEIVQSPRVTVEMMRGRSRLRRTIFTHNRLLGTFEGADGVKTGFTEHAGRCLVATAVRDDRRLIAVLLNDRQRFSDAALLLEYGFSLQGIQVQRPTFPEGGEEGNFSGEGGW